jgi:hypothetical protein
MVKEAALYFCHAHIPMFSPRQEILNIFLCSFRKLKSGILQDITQRGKIDHIRHFAFTVSDLRIDEFVN